MTEPKGCPTPGACSCPPMTPDIIAKIEAETPYRCFHCDEVFSNEVEARNHFGVWEHDEPACKLARHEHGLMGYVRELEKRIASYQSESDPVSIAWYGRQAEHAQALVREEEKGYARGLRDGRSLANPKEPTDDR